MIEVENLVHRYDGHTVLSLSHWQLEAGDAALVLGPSGSGKSTFVHALTGLLTPSGGRIGIGGTDITCLTPAARDTFRGKTFGIIFQTLRLVSSLTVEQNMTLARQLCGRPPDGAGARRLLEELGIAHLARRKPRALSVGEAQRAAIARAVVGAPPILIADEPTSALDDANARAVARLLLRLAGDAGSTVLIATHDARLAPLFGRRLQLEVAR